MHIKKELIGKWYIVSVNNESIRYQTPDGREVFDPLEGYEILEEFQERPIMLADANFWWFKHGDHEKTDMLTLVHSTITDSS